MTSYTQSGVSVAMSPAMSRLSSAIECAFHSSRISRYNSGVTSRDSSSRTSISALPRLDQLDLQPKLVDDALHDEVDELADFLGSLIEARCRRQHDRARFNRERHVAQMHERERRLAGDQYELAALLERHVRRA